MSGSRHPFSAVGVTPSLRQTLYSRPCGRDVRARLASGADVVLEGDWLRSHFPLARAQHPALPEAFTAEAYRLTGDNTLEPLS